METNYELKHKCLLVPLKVALLVIAMVLVGFTTYAQQGKAIKVANDGQLIEAMQNPSIGIIELEAGYYAYLNVYAESGTRVVKQVKEDGNRDSNGCTYFIITRSVCFDPAPGGSGYVSSVAEAGTSSADCPPLDPNCCPDGDTGHWIFVDGPAGANLNFISPLEFYFMQFEVDMPGVYTLGYEWDPALDPTLPEYAYVETEYYFYGPVTVDLSAPDVCEFDGLSTEVTFTLESDYEDPNTVVTWTLNGQPYAGPEESDIFTLTVPECGYYVLAVLVEPSKCPPVEEEIWIDFSCQPTADAGPDVNVCDDVCAFLDGTITVAQWSPTYAYSWVNISGPGGQELTFLPNDGFMEEDVDACRDELECSYGEYEVQLQVQNGQCYDDDNAIVRFYEQPTADAGPDQHLCEMFSFDLEGVEYDYCGVEGVNFWREHHWEFVSGPVTPTITDPNSPTSGVTIDINGVECPYGAYTFRWTETNSQGPDLGGCYAEDYVTIYVYETPYPDAGEDFVLCDTWEFDLYGMGDEPCYTPTVIVYSWDKSAQPGDCQIELDDLNVLDPHVTISNCDPDCPYGEYIFTLTQQNGYMDGNNFVEVCSGTDDVSVWIFESVDAYAGPDQHLCNTFDFAFSAIPTEFCGEPGVNYNTWGVWSQVGGVVTATIADVNDPGSTVSIDPDADPCPYGVYTFMWTEYNGFNTPEGFVGCSDEDLVSIFIYEQPDIDAGMDQTWCDVSTIQLEGSFEPNCAEQAYWISWELISQPGSCTVTFNDPTIINPVVTITDCAPCQYGEYVFRVTQSTGYWQDNGDGTFTFIMVCEDSDEVSVWIAEQPTEIDAGPDQLLCNEYTFDLAGVGFDFCGDYGVNYNNWYSWVLVSQPGDASCEVTFADMTSPATTVTVGPCTGECPYGEFVFGLTEYNGWGDGVCEAYDEVSVFIFEMPDADAGADVNACIDIQEFPYCVDMTGSMDYCYSMVGVWTKTCGPGDVVFDDINSPTSNACFDEPGRYVFTWTAWNGAEGCMDEDEVVFDLLEQPNANAEVRTLEAPCDELCISLADAYVLKYMYVGTDEGECPNFQDMAHWELIDGPGLVTFADDTDPATELCVSTYGGYTVRWNEVNMAVDGESWCEDYVDIYVEFNETPEPMAEGGEICGTCFTLDGTLDVGFNPEFHWEVLPGGNCPVSLDIFELDPEVCIDDILECYGTYGFVLHQFNGECEGTDTAWVTFKKLPDPVAICFNNDPNYCGPNEGGPGRDLNFDYGGCLLPGETIEVCAEGCSWFYLDPWCECIPGFDWSNPYYWGWTFEWSVIAPAGTTVNSTPGYYDFENGYWVYPYLNVCWGECCDTARIYLTITTDEDCELTLEYDAYVNHKPCAEIVGPDVSEVDAVTTYCNVCPPDFDQSCLLYTWTAEHCGEIIGGQGTECIDVLWTDYNINGGWGEITLTVFDTCTGCCNYDEMMVKIWPSGTLGDATLSGHVYYQNNFMTPLNGVEIQLWNGGIPVMSTMSFNDIEGGNGVGYYEFPGISGITNFGVTASYGAPWYGANATDALAVELYAISMPVVPGWIVNQPLQEEAMDVNNNAAINATDALWIKQRAISMVGYFPAGDWAFEPGMSTTAQSDYDIMTLNAGDVNRSNIPASMKSAPDIALVNDGTMNVVTGEVFELPIRVANADQFGAITLNLEYNSALLEVVDVVAQEGMIDNISNGLVSIAWSNVNPMVLADNDVVLTLKVKAIGEISAAEPMFRIGLGSEFADPTASVIEPVTLKAFGITTEPAATDYFLSSNRPNPFSTSTFIEYTMPETGKVKLSVLDMLGQEIAVLVEATQTAGSYTVEFSAAGLATGVYIYKITVDGETRDFISTQRMVISH